MESFCARSGAAGSLWTCEAASEWQSDSLFWWWAITATPTAAFVGLEEVKLRCRSREIAAEHICLRRCMASSSFSVLRCRFGESLHAVQRALSAHDRENLHEQHAPLQKADVPGHPAVPSGS